MSESPRNVARVSTRQITPAHGDVGLREEAANPTTGLAREKNRVLVEYALGGSTQPISVAEWEIQLTRTLPQELQENLPTIEEIEAELAGDMGTMEGEQND